MSKAEGRIEAVLDQVRPFIQMHGGGVALVDYREGVVTLELAGACRGCRLADLTYKQMIGQLLREAVPEVKEIVLQVNNKKKSHGQSDGVSAES
jgi:NFU1 iron-sulfur cluster scaffold homolog, mitochondrial